MHFAFYNQLMTTERPGLLLGVPARNAHGDWRDSCARAVFHYFLCFQRAHVAGIVTVAKTTAPGCSILGFHTYKTLPFFPQFYAAPNAWAM